MLSRFKKFGQNIQKASKSVEEGLGKAGKSVGKGFDRVSRSHDAKSKTDSARSNAEETGKEDRPGTATPTERGSRAAADRSSVHSIPQAAAITPEPSPTPKPAEPSPPPKATAASSNASEIQFDLDSEERSDHAAVAAVPVTPPRAAAATGAASPPPHAPPPRIPRARDGAAGHAIVTATDGVSAPTKQSQAVSHQTSEGATPAESNLSVHGPDKAGLAPSNRGAGSVAALSTNSSILFDMNATGSATRKTPSLPPRAAKPASDAGGQEGGLATKHTTSISFDFVPDRDGEEEQPPLADADTDGAAPRVRETTTGPRVNERDEVLLDISDSEAPEGSVAATEELVVVDERPTRQSSGRASVASRKKQARRVSPTKPAPEEREKGNETGDAKPKRTRRRKSNSAAGEKEKGDRDNITDGGASAAAHRDPTRSKTSRSTRRTRRREDKARPPSTRSASSRRKKKSLSPLSEETLPSQTSTSPAASVSGSEGQRRSARAAKPAGDAQKSEQHHARRGRRPSSSNGRQRSRSRGAVSPHSTTRSDRDHKTPNVPRDVQRIFEQCRLDANGLVAPSGRRRRNVSPPMPNVAPLPESRSRSARRRSSSPWDRPQHRNFLRSAVHDAPGGDRQRRRSDSRGSRFESPPDGSHRRTGSPRGKYSGVRHGRLSAFDNAGGYHSSDSCSCETSFVSYDPQQRELYRGSPRGLAVRAPSNRQRHLSPDNDWRFPPRRNSGLVESVADRSSQHVSPWRQRRQQQQQRRPSSTEPSRGHGAGANYYVERSPVQRLSRYAPPSPVEYRVVRQQLSEASQPLSLSAEHSLANEEQILEEVEHKLEVLAEQIAYMDFALEQDMMSSPFERLYHMNNRRDRSERRELLNRFNKLQTIHEKIVSGALDREIAEREERQRVMEEKLRDPESVYMRLYKSPRRRGAELEMALNEKGGGGGSAVSSRGASPAAASSGAGSARRNRSRRRSRTRAEQDAYFNRIHASAVNGMRRRQEEAEAARKEREEQESNDLLAARLAGRLQRASPTRSTPVLSPEALLAKAREKIQAEKQKGKEEAQLAKELLQDRRLTRKEEARMASRLTKQGLQTEEKREAQRTARVLEECTFKPEINEHRPTRKATDSADSESESDQDSAETGSSEARGDRSQRRQRHATGGRFEELYQQGMASKQRAEAMRAEKDRELRLRILKSRLSEDHHFRRRVELDPSLAERYMRSLEV